MTGIFHACLEFMNRKIGLIPFLTGVFVNKHVKTLLFDKIEESVSECALAAWWREQKPQLRQ